MSEYRLHTPGTIPECTTPQWYANREHAPHLEQPTHRARILAAAAATVEIAQILGASTAVDLGAGDGGLLSLLGPSITGWGYDLQPTNIAAAKNRNVNVKLADITTDPIEWGEIVIATELLEHLRDPHGLVSSAAQHGRALVCSSPCEETPESHYEHHVWAWDRPGFAKMITDGGWRIVHHNTIYATQLISAIR